MLKLLLINQEAAERERLITDVPWLDLGFDVDSFSCQNGDSFSFVSDLQNVVAMIYHIHLLADIKTVVEIKRAKPEIQMILTNPDWPFELLKAALKIGASYYLASPINIDELYEVLQRIHSICMEQHEAVRLQKNILAAGIAQHLDRYNSSLPAQINLEDLLAAYFNIELQQQDVPYYLALISIGEYRYIIQNQDILSFTIADVVQSIQQLCAIMGCMLVQLSSQDFVLISPESMEAALKEWQSQNQEINEFTTAIYEKEPLYPKDLKETIRELRILKNNFVLTNGSGKLYEKHEAAACIGEIPPAKVFSFDLNELIHALIQNNASKAQQELAKFFSENMCDNIHMLTVELVEQIDRELSSHSIRSTFSSKRKSMLIKRLLDVESAKMLQQMMQAYLDDLMTLLTSAENNYHERIVQDTIAYIHQHFREPFTIEELADSLHYSPNHLRYVFKNTTGHTLSEEIASTRMNHARKLLEDTTMRIHEISQSVGYTNPSYFISQFLKKYGATPVQYRQHLNQ